MDACDGGIVQNYIMKPKGKAPSIATLSGFPEWLPQQQIVQEQFVARIRKHFELAGFTPLQSRSVEPLDVLLSKGETDKEIYVLRRIHADEQGSDSGLGLHFDLTVPFARFVSEREGMLTFPLKRYQIQPAWRGERPQEGRYREFIQADADIVGMGSLPLQHDVELPGLLIEILDAFPMPKVTILINNRKVMDGFFKALGIVDAAETLRIVDKLAKIGEEKVAQILQRTLSESQTQAILKLCHIQSDDCSFVDEVRALGVSSPILDEGLTELAAVVEGNSHLRRGAIRADLRIARGFDYYTGTVYEGLMEGFESIGAVCSGGRYENLVSEASAGKKNYPGIGVSIGVTRILGLLMGRGHLVASRSTPTCVLVALNNAESRPASVAVARALRSRQIPAEVFDEPRKFGDQIKYATKKGIPYVWFCDVDGSGRHEVRDLSESSQSEADPASWLPKPELLEPTIIYTPPEQSSP